MPSKLSSKTDVATPPRLVKRDGKVLRLGDNTDAMAFETLTIQPQVQGSVSVQPQVTAASVTVTS